MLYYCQNSGAYFTNKPLSEQCGDDWNDIPYEHNAGAPYGEGIVKVAWDGPFKLPGEHCINSSYSVDRIKQGAVPWLVTASWHTEFVSIPAGTSLEDFCKLIQKGGGNVYHGPNTKIILG